MVSRSFRSWLVRGSWLCLKLLCLVGVVSCAWGSALVAEAASGVITKQINYQGRLMDSGGSDVADGTYQMEFSLYDVASGGTPFWTATGTTAAPEKIPVTVNNGLFTVMLGDTSVSGGTQSPLEGIDWNNDTIYLGVTIGADAEMTPRKRLGAVPQAFNAMQLQGMYASSTAGDGQSVFSVHQTSQTAAGVDRSALDVRTQGISDTKDYIARFFSGTGDIAQFSIRNDGYTTAKRLYAMASTTGAIVTGLNVGEKIQGNTWGGAFNRLLAGTMSPETATGTLDMVTVMRYEGSHENALCLDNAETNDTCGFVAGASLIADGTINASAFDLAEQYEITGEAAPGDVLVLDESNPMFVRKSTGATDERLVGIVSTRPGLLLGDLEEGVRVALAGRVPTHVSIANGPIAVGDALTAAPVPGMAMKATSPGQILGYALQPASATGTIEVFVKVGYDASAFLRTAQGQTTANGSLVFGSTQSATVGVPAANSWGITWRGSLWDGIQAINKDFQLLNEPVVGGPATFALKAGTSTVWSVNESGVMRTSGDFFLGGRFFPATRSGAQTDKYIFLDDTGPASSTYIATNADGWQANTSYDFAERYYSPDALEPGDVVVLSQRGRFHVQRSMKQGDVPVGIVSTKPAFVAGAPEPSTFPIALAGRVPTRVSAGAGAIQVGDPLTVSPMPGVAVKAIQAGPIVGYALEDYSSATVGTIEVFVNAGWWGGSAIIMNESKPEKVGLVAAPSATVVLPKSYQGVARILAGATKVKVVHPSLGTFPLIQVTPYGKVDTQWWTDNSSDRGFEIILKEPLAQDVTFSWRAEEMKPADNQLFLSNEEPAEWDIYNGQPVIRGGQSQVPTQPETLPEVTSATTTPEVPETSSVTTISEVPAPAPAPVEEIPVPAEPAEPAEPVSPEPVVSPPTEPEIVDSVPTTEPAPEESSPPVEPAPVESAPVEPVT